MIMPLRGHSPQIGEGSYVAPSADIIGDVVTGESCSIWFNVTIRGDVMPIRIGNETNIQDNSVIHGTFKKCGTQIGDRVTIGHGVLLHGCTIGDRCLIGMGCVIMDLAKIPRHSIVAAGSLVTQGSEFEEGWLIMGRPAKAVRRLTDEEIAFLDQSAENYLMYKKWYETDGE